MSGNHKIQHDEIFKYVKKKGYVNNPVVDPLTALWSDL